MIPNINGNLSNVAGNFGVNIHVLERLEFTGNDKNIGDVFPFDWYNGRGRRAALFVALVVSLSA
jgi:hypothetical protein